MNTDAVTNSGSSEGNSSKPVKKTKIRRIGSSLGIILPSAVLYAANLQEGQELQVVNANELGIWLRAVPVTAGIETNKS